MMRYNDIMDEINWIYDSYNQGILRPDSASPIGFLIDDNHMRDEFFDLRGKRLFFHLKTPQAFVYIVYYLFVFSKNGVYVESSIFNCYFKAKDEFACKKLEKEMAFIEKFYEDNFDKIPTKYEELYYIPESGKSKNQ